ncbi:MAG TPA: S8 family serine peptidase [Bryobacteraceae bacterium]|nr:S8 family serine peptidase [Bryobacteraceae bacterium]
MRKIILHRTWMLLSIFCFAFAVNLLAQPRPDDRVDVLVGFGSQPGPAEEALIRNLGGTVKRTFRIIPAIAANLPQRAVEALRNLPNVVVEADAQLHALDEYTSVWGIQKIAAKAAHDGGNRGLGRKICVIDSGMDRNHSELFNRYAGGWDFVNNDNDPTDDNGHGTHVAGTIAAELNSLNIVGAAPDAQLLVYKILDAGGSGSFSNAIAAVERCQTDGGIITNNSYGASSDPGSLVKAAFDNAYNAGILHVAAAGNATLFTCNSVSYPARYSSVIAVGATDSADAIAYFSCRGPEVELTAPGVNIYSTYPANTYATASGTSMAAPHVAGTAALVFNCGLVDQNGDTKVNNIDVRLRLQQTALDLGTAGRDSSYGYGRVRADAATAGCSAPPPPPSAPPAGPTGLTANPGASGGSRFIGLVWTDNANNETGFKIERCQGSTCTDFSQIATVGANVTTYQNSGLSKNRTYSYRVRAYNSDGNSTYSNVASAKTAP